MDSDEKKQNLDLENKSDIKKDQNPDLINKAEDTEKRESNSADNLKEKAKNPEEERALGKKPLKLPVKALVPAVIVVIAVVVIAIFLVHPAKTSVQTVSYTAINYLSNSGLNSIIGGNWSLIYNTTANSTVINKYAGTGDFPSGTVAAVIQEFVPYSEIAANSSTKNISDFTTTVYYLNSSSTANSLFGEIDGILGLQYANHSKVDYNLSSIGNTSMIYINGRLNSSNSSTENATELYLMDGKSVVVATLSNDNMDYKQARDITAYLFS